MKKIKLKNSIFLKTLSLININKSVFYFKQTLSSRHLNSSNNLNHSGVIAINDKNHQLKIFPNTKNEFKIKIYDKYYKNRLVSSFTKFIKYDKSVLTDSFGRFHNYLRISLTEKCNLRCTYCMPEKGVDLTEINKLTTREELSKLINIFAKCGVDKIRLTGGEPTINKELVSIVREIRSYKTIKSVGITTNGLILNKYLVGLKDAGLTNINISLDTLVEAKFNFISKRKGVDRVINNINKALDMGFQKVKVNCVLMKGVNDDEIIDFVDLTKHKNLDLRFIEFMPFLENSRNILNLL
jgi:uncharacterized Fe-S cluster-containing radical SAM superfamily enzyme